MSGIDVLRERIARALWDKAQHKQPEGRLARSWDEAPIPSREELIAYADAVIAVLGLVETEWARAFERGDGSLFVDTEDDSYASYSDAAERTTLYDEHSPYDFVVSRYVTPWERIEEDA